MRRQSRIAKVTISVPLGQVISPDNIATIIQNANNLAMNQDQIPADEIELHILGTPDMVGTQRAVDSAAASIQKGNADLQTAIDKEKAI